MSAHQWESAYYAASDALERYRRDELAEHVQAAAEQDEHRTDWKPPPRVKRTATRPSVESKAWREAILDRDQGCVVHANPADCGEGWQAHHVVPQQVLRRERAEAIWNPLSGMCVCGLVHRQHHAGRVPIPYEAIPLAVRSFLAEQGFGGYLFRHYELAL